jgi:hypothetical protein
MQLLIYCCPRRLQVSLLNADHLTISFASVLGIRTDKILEQDNSIHHVISNLSDAMSQPGDDTASHISPSKGISSSLPTARFTLIFKGIPCTIN